MKKEDNLMKNDDAVGFEYPNHQHPGYENKIRYEDHICKHPTNNAAKRVDASKVMRQVREGK